MAINKNPISHTSNYGTKFSAVHADLSDGVTVIRNESTSIEHFAADVAEFSAWHRGNIWEQLNGFSGYDCIRFTIKNQKE